MHDFDGWGEPTLQQWKGLNREVWFSLMHQMLHDDAKRNGDEVRQKFHASKLQTISWYRQGRAEQRLWDMGFGYCSMHVLR